MAKGHPIPFAWDWATVPKRVALETHEELLQEIARRRARGAYIARKASLGGTLGGRLKGTTQAFVAANESNAATDSSTHRLLGLQP